MYIELINILKLSKLNCWIISGFFFLLYLFEKL